MLARGFSLYVVELHQRKDVRFGTTNTIGEGRDFYPRNENVDVDHENDENYDHNRTLLTTERRLCSTYKQVSWVKIVIRGQF